MNVLHWVKNRVINLLALLRGEDDRLSSLTIIPDYSTAFFLALARAYSTPDKKPDEFVITFYDEFERYMVAVGGRAREDVKEVYTRREFYDKLARHFFEPRKDEGGVRLA